MWCVAELDQEYIEKMEDVLAIYEKLYDPVEPVVCLDEKPVSLHVDVRSAMPARPGKPVRRDNEYKRCGTANVFAVVERKQDGISRGDARSMRRRVRQDGGEHC